MCTGKFAGLTPEQFLGRYFSEQHRDDLGQGCPTAALMSEMHGQSKEARLAFHAGFTRFAAMLSETLRSGGAPGGHDFSMLALAAMAGTLAISRALQGVDRDLADSVLHSVAGQLPEVLALPARQGDAGGAAGKGSGSFLKKEPKNFCVCTVSAARYPRNELCG